RAYAVLAGEKGVRELGDALAANRARADGLSYSVRGALVTALTPLDPRPAVPALLDDLALAGQKGWNLDYGSKVVRALNAAGTPEALAGIAAYADLLAEKRPSDPLAKRSFDTKID